MACLAQTLQTGDVYGVIVDRFLQTLFPKISNKFREPSNRAVKSLAQVVAFRRDGFTVGCAHLTSDGFMIPMHCLTGPKR